MLKHSWLYLLLILVLMSTSAVRAQTTGGISLSVVVRDEYGQPVEGSRVSVAEIGLEALTGPDGRVNWQGLALGKAYTRVTLTVEASGFGPWTYTDLRLIDGDDLLLAPVLTAEAVSLTIPAPEYTVFGELDDYEAARFQNFLRTIDLSSPMPETLRLRMVANPFVCDPNAPYTLQDVNFQEYVRNVLPNEWAALWDTEALKAGAVAIKMYAWYWVSRGGKWGDADLTNSICDQLYIPGSAHPRSDDAVRETWGWKLERAGDLFQPQHLRICDLPSCMDQDLGAKMARQGFTWQELMGHFYPGSALKFEGSTYTFYTYIPAVNADNNR